MLNIQELDMTIFSITPNTIISESVSVTSQEKSDLITDMHI
jgi:hypothetical protein